MRMSIRNQLNGTVLSITRGAAMAVVKVQLFDSEAVLTSSITVDGAEDLGIEEGKNVTLLIKSTDVSLGVE